LVVLLFWAATTASADTVVDTGPGASSGSGYAVYRDASAFQYLAGQFKLTAATTIGSVEGWISNDGGTVSLAIYANSGILPDESAELFRQSFTIPHIPGPGGTADWNGVTGMTLALGPGTYWAAFEVPNAGDFQGAMPHPVPSPLTRYATKNSGLPTWFASGLNVGFRIQTAAPAPAPEPVTALLLCLGGALVLARSRRPLR